MSTPEAGEIGVVRNGGPFDNKNIRGIVDNGSGNTGIGLFSTVHYYPVDTQQRFIKMDRCYGSGDPNCDADAPPVTVPTSDGVEATIEGTIYLNTVFNNSSEGKDAVKKFDTQFATRTFGDGFRAYDGPEGWKAFLTAIIQPIVTNNLRDTISGVQCADLVSSCALVQNQGANSEDIAKVVAGKNNQGKVKAVQEAVANGLAKDLETTLKAQYFGNISFKLARVTLPKQVQNAINDAQSAFAQVSQSQAKVEQAKAEAKANEERQQGYNNCPACREIDAIKAWAGTGVTTVVQGGAGASVSVK